MKAVLGQARGPLSVGVERGPSVVTVTAVGEVDRDTTPLWREAWNGLWRAGVTAPVVLADLTRVTFFGSSGSIVLREVHDEARKAGLTLVVAASRPVRRSSQIIGIDARIALCTTLDEARAHATRAEKRIAHWEPMPPPREGASPAELVRHLRAENKQLREALDSRVVLEQAKGMLMARHEITPDEAFELLRQLSQHTNVKLRDLAAQVLDTAVPAAGLSRAAGCRRGT
ncbi:ANTAR domain-containing protein [Amycolatopsis rubida]|uniref:ANTAR domain-containing protein n=1 Tax=Amycolatopsis rubida TaxID=112413 RepID=A0ABX0BL71_9PSEU|nr:ANTAR domain-containing protein [Amycolatopsis sp. M39]MYW90721.1 ANTAR domain-containing protein [Amycolatopsis rubida]NEC55704.1 ANTAR domain-containing protein [Amycolatopsis rubida]OAP21796.1 ANTAR domain protein [Amycolatopsis sp. M39]